MSLAKKNSIVLSSETKASGDNDSGDGADDDDPVVDAREVDNSKGGISDWNWWWWAVIGVGGLLICLLLTVGIVCFRRRRKVQQDWIYGSKNIEHTISGPMDTPGGPGLLIMIYMHVHVYTGIYMYI